MNPIIKLWQRRQKLSQFETIRYMRDAARGGLPAFLMLGFIIGSYAYGKALQHIAPDFPYWWVAVATLLPVLVPSPVRTYLRSADIAFLLPAEDRMAPYFRRSFAYSFAVQGFALSAVVVVLWPLYSHFHPASTIPFWIIWLFFLTAKGMQLFAGWNEARLVYEAHRKVVKIYRWIWGGMIVYAAYKYSLLTALVIAASGLLLLSALLFRMPRHRTAWETLIREEEQTRNRRFTVFNWFADVPQLQGMAKKRALWAPIIRRLTFKSNSAYVYLYAMTFLRSELFSLALRLTLVELFLLVVLRTPASLLLLLIVFLAVSALQLSGLSQYHRLSVWPKLYPIAPAQRTLAQAKVMRAVLLIQSVIAGTAAIVLAGSPVWFVALAGLIAVSYGYPSFWAKRLLKRA